jgi:hypothetical protein
MVGDMTLRILYVMSVRNVIQFLWSLFLLLLVNINEIIILYALFFVCALKILSSILRRKGKYFLRRIFHHKIDQLIGHGECEVANNIMVYKGCPRRKGQYSERSWYRSF